MYAARSDRNYVPIKIGSICVLISGIVLNVVFIINFHKTVKVDDKEFDRWRKRKSFISNLYLFLSGTISLTIYRLIFCRLFRLEIMEVSTSKPVLFLRPILIFTWIKLLVFNVPLIIVDIYGLSILDWGNQCFMTMQESMILSFISGILMIIEQKQNTTLMDRERSSINLEKLDKGKQTGGDGGTGRGTGGGSGAAGPSDLPFKKGLFGKKGRGAALAQVQSEETVPLKDKGKKGAALGVAVTREQVNLSAIKHNLKNNVTMAEIKDAEEREPASPKTYGKRIDQLTTLMAIVKKNKGHFLNNELDAIYDVGREALLDKPIRRVKSMQNMKTETHNNLNDSFESFCGADSSKADTFPYFKINEEAVRERFKELKTWLEEQKITQNEKADQYSDPEEDNIYISARDPPPEIIQEDHEVQTD